MSRWTQLDDNAAGPPQPGGPGRITYGDDAHPEAIQLYSDGALLSGHDALYAFNDELRANTNGTPVAVSAADTGSPRVTLDVGQRVKWAWPMQPRWEALAVRWMWTNELAGAGNVTWQLAYRQQTLAGGACNGAMTNIAIPAITAPAQFAWNYATPAASSAIVIVPGALFNDAPIIEFALSRVGGTLGAGGASVLFATGTRIDL